MTNRGGSSLIQEALISQDAFDMKEFEVACEDIRRALLGLPTSMEAFAENLFVEGEKNPAQVTECFQRQFPDISGGMVENIVASALSRKMSCERRWPTVTDVDRLYAAMAELEGKNFIAMHSVSGGMEEGERVANAMWKRLSDVTKFAYVFYNHLDVEEVIREGRLLLTYACFEQHGGLQLIEEMQAFMGGVIVETLRRHGLSVVWSGSTGDKIAVHMNWLKRVPQEPVAFDWEETAAPRYADFHFDDSEEWEPFPTTFLTAFPETIS